MSNPYIKAKLRRMGMTPLTAFGCLFDFLYRPTPAAVRPFVSRLPLLLETSTLKLGIQIRTGDAYLWRQQPELSLERYVL
jgi:hypothetical protein